jgi:hypothetical protein
MTVSGRTVANRERQSLQMQDSNPQQAVKRSQLGALSRRALQHPDLVPQIQVLQLEGRARTEDRTQIGNQSRKKNDLSKGEL